MDWLEQIGNYDPLSNKEQHKLIYEWQTNKNIKARNKLILHNMRYAISFSKKYINTGVPLSDLINQCTLGLIEAINKFDFNKRNKQGKHYAFLTYATWLMFKQIQILKQSQTVIKQQNRNKKKYVPVTLFSQIDMSNVQEKYYIDNYKQIIEKDNLEYLLSDLSDRYKKILLMRINGKTLQYIANEHNVSKQRIRQIIKRAYEKILSNKNITQ